MTDWNDTVASLVWGVADSDASTPPQAGNFDVAQMTKLRMDEPDDQWDPVADPTWTWV